MKGFLEFVRFGVREKAVALKNKETYLFFISGWMLVVGLVHPPLNYMFYLGFIYPALMIYRGQTSQSSLFYYLLPYYLVLGFGVWNRIFPFYLGIVLAIALADPVSKLFYLVSIKTRSAYIKPFMLPTCFFIYDFIFQKIWPFQMVEMTPVLSPIYNHTFILKIASILGSHTTLFIVTATISGIVAASVERRIFDKKVLIVACGIILIVTPNVVHMNKDNTNNSRINSVKVAAVQGRIEFSRKFDNAADYGEFVISNYKSLVEDKEADIFVFPEYVSGLYDKANVRDKENRRQMSEFARQKDALMAFTVTELDSRSNTKENRFITSLLVSPDGLIGKSSKRNLVPFTEGKRYSRGKDYQVFDTKCGRIGISICYDTNYWTIEELKMNGAQLILAPFNDSGFGRVFHNIHRYYPVIKAIECSIPIAVSNYDGISQLIDRQGNVVKELGYGERGVIIHELKVLSSPSYYLMFGRYAEWGLFAGVVLLFLKLSWGRLIQLSRLLSHSSGGRG